jgi:hypothetical protein
MLEQLKEFERTVTAGPWEHVHVQRNEWAEWNFVRSLTAVVENDRGPNYHIQIASDEDYETKNADHAFMAFMRNNLPAIIKALENDNG